MFAEFVEQQYFVDAICDAARHSKTSPSRLGPTSEPQLRQRLHRRRLLPRPPALRRRRGVGGRKRGRRRGGGLRGEDVGEEAAEGRAGLRQLLVAALMSLGRRRRRLDTPPLGNSGRGSGGNYRRRGPTWGMLRQPGQLLDRRPEAYRRPSADAVHHPLAARGHKGRSLGRQQVYRHGARAEGPRPPRSRGALCVGEVHH
mmetsp:Transcript_110/g.461  ORF Transcript_110/g.461 Transcript_110/m.461 type:complete len:200 (+) Transcript_110:44-643(+)